MARRRATDPDEIGVPLPGDAVVTDPDLVMNRGLRERLAVAGRGVGNSDMSE